MSVRGGAQKIVKSKVILTGEVLISRMRYHESEYQCDFLVILG